MFYYCQATLNNWTATEGAYCTWRSAHLATIMHTSICLSVESEMCHKRVLASLLVPPSAVAVGLVMAHVSLTLAGSSWGYSCDAVMCADLGRFCTFPFGRRWPFALKTRRCLSREVLNSQCNGTENTQPPVCSVHLSRMSCGCDRFHPLISVLLICIQFHSFIFCQFTTVTSRHFKRQGLRPYATKSRKSHTELHLIVANLLIVYSHTQIHSFILYIYSAVVIIWRGQTPFKSCCSGRSILVSFATYLPYIPLYCTYSGRCLF